MDDCRLTQKTQHLSQKYYKQFFRDNYNKADVLDLADEDALLVEEVAAAAKTTV